MQLRNESFNSFRLFKYNKITKKPLLAIEIDGYEFHKEGTAQAERDKLKNNIMNTCHIKLLRFKTNGSGEKKKIINELDELIVYKFLRRKVIYMTYYVPNMIFEEALKFYKKLEKIDPKDEFVFDFSRMGKFDPLPMLMMGATMRN